MSPDRSQLRQGFQLGPWTVIPDRGLLQQGERSIHLEPLVMDVLLVLVEHQGQVVSKDQLADIVWKGRATADDAIASKIFALRSKLGDSKKESTYVETVQKRGYRLKNSVDVRLTGERVEKSVSPRWSAAIGIAAVAALAVILVVVVWPTAESLRSVAVLQFSNLSEEASRFQYVADGFSEELVVSLDHVPNLRITRGGRASDSKLPQEIAKDLKVDAVINGSLRTDGNRIRITVELISADGFHLWTDRIDGESRDIFSIQERVANQVRNALLDEPDHRLIATSRPANPEAFDAYMRGLFLLAKRDPPSLQSASELFEETTKLDPGFGPAYLRHAITLLLLADYSPENGDEFYAAALDIASRGAERDPQIQLPVQLVYGYVHHQRGHWKESYDAYELALRAATVYPTVHHWFSRLLGDMGFADRALEHALKARDLEPASQILNSRVAIAYLWNNDLQNAERYFRMANTMGVGVPDHHFAYALYLLRKQRIEDARASARSGVDLAQRPSWWVDPVFDSIAEPGNANLAESVSEIIASIEADEKVFPYIPMTLWALTGRPEQALGVAERQLERTGALKNMELLYLDEFEAVRQLSEFPALLARLGLTDYWSLHNCRWGGTRPTCGAD